MERKQATRKHFNNLSECEAFVDSLTYLNMRNWLISFLLEETPDKIIISEEQFKAFFKIRGINEEGKEERRGRPKKQ